MSNRDHQARRLSVLVVDPVDTSYDTRDTPVGVDHCATGRAALRRVDEAFDVLVLSTNIVDVDYEHLAEMFLAESPDTSLVVVSNEPSATEEAVARRCGAVLYLGKPLNLEWIAQLQTRSKAGATSRGRTSQLTLDWRRRVRPAANQPASASR